MIRVAIIEDHFVLVDALSLMLRQEKDMEFVGAAGTLVEGGSLVRNTRPDVLLLDLCLPDGNGLDWITQFRALSPKTQIVVLTSYSDDGTLRMAIDLGVSGFLCKSSPLSELTSGIHKAAEGEMIIPTSLLVSLLKRQSRDRVAEFADENGWEPLTSRELEVLTCLARGKSGTSIAGELNIAPLTVRTHVRNLMTKLGVHSRLEAVSIGLKRGLIEGPV